MATAQKSMESIGRPHTPQTPSGTSSTMGGTIQAVKEQTKNVVDSATDMANEAKDKLQEVASNVKESTLDLASAAADKTRELAGAAADKTRELANVAAETAEDFGKELTTLVRRYPIPALLVGFGIGLLVGRVSRI